MAWPTCRIAGADGVGMVKLEVRGREERYAEDTGERRYLRIDVRYPSQDAAALLQEWLTKRQRVDVHDEGQSWSATDVEVTRIGTPAAGGLAITLRPADGKKA